MIWQNNIFVSTGSEAHIEEEGGSNIPDLKQVRLEQRLLHNVNGWVEQLNRWRLLIGTMPN